MKYLSLDVPGYPNLHGPAQIPEGGSEKLMAMARNIMVYVFGFAIFFCLILLIWGGILWITSGGDAKKIGQARMRITYALIGLALIFGSFALMQILSTVFHVKLLG